MSGDAEAQEDRRRAEERLDFAVESNGLLHDWAGGPRAYLTATSECQLLRCDRNLRVPKAIKHP
jgi:hypothetical protein